MLTKKVTKNIITTRLNVSCAELSSHESIPINQPAMMLLSSAQDTFSRVVMIFLVTFLVSIAGLHHCIVGSIEVFVAFFAEANQISLAQFLKFQGLATLGNIIGGVFLVAIVKYAHSRRH